MINVIQNTIGSLARRGSETPSFTGLLDTYSGAAVGYSLRRLRTAYSGDCVTVRRASDSTELDIGFINNTLDIASLETFCAGTDGFVTTWYDQSVNGDNAVNSTAVNQPKIVASGSYLGYIENMIASNGQLLHSTYQYPTSPTSIFMVAQNYGGALFGGVSSGNRFFAVSESGSSTSAQGGFNSVSYFSNSSAIGSTRGNIHTATISFSLLTTLATSTASDEYTTLGYIFKGLNSSRYKEFIIFPNQTVSRTGVDSNIVNFYNF